MPANSRWIVARCLPNRCATAAALNPAADIASILTRSSKHKRRAILKTSTGRLLTELTGHHGRSVATTGRVRQPCEASTAYPTPSSAPPQSPKSPASSKTQTCPQRSTGWDAPSGTGAPRSPTGTPPGSPTAEPKSLTTSSNASNAPPSSELTSTTTESRPCYTPASPTGHCSTPSPRPNSRSASLTTRIQQSWILFQQQAEMRIAMLCTVMTTRTTRTAAARQTASKRRSPD